MSQVLAISLVVPALVLIASAMVPNRIANRHVNGFRIWVTAIAAIQFVVAVVCGLILLAGQNGWQIGPIDEAIVSVPASVPIHLCVYFDAVSSLMLGLVSFVGWVICRYSVRYLDGEDTQGRYFRWVGFTIGAVALMVISGNLLLFVACWVMTSLGLHQLLLHYGDRPAAQRAAWTKFGISRLGDAALIGAMLLIYAQFKTFDFAELFAAVQDSPEITLSTHLAGFFLVVGAITKSAQFPFHTWLPLTMETPTPVSALMHAGIVNAGGYLIVRTSPLIAMTPWVLSILAIVGAVTACLAGIIMLTQPSVKKKLAYSTIAQMGFMLLQCGLGAFSAAMLHILAHSLYKAYAFLSSGSVMSQRESMMGAKQPDESFPLFKVVATALVIITFFGLSLALFGINPLEKPGGMLLGGIVCLALTFWVSQVIQTRDGTLLVRSFAIAGILCLAYVASYATVDSLIRESIPTIAIQPATVLMTALIGLMFVGVFAFQAQLSAAGANASATSLWIHKFYVHASNGFYIEHFLRRRFGPRTM